MPLSSVEALPSKLTEEPAVAVLSAPAFATGALSAVEADEPLLEASAVLPYRPMFITPPFGEGSLLQIHLELPSSISGLDIESVTHLPLE